MNTLFAGRGWGAGLVVALALGGGCTDGSDATMSGFSISGNPSVGSPSGSSHGSRASPGETTSTTGSTGSTPTTGAVETTTAGSTTAPLSCGDGTVDAVEEC